MNLEVKRRPLFQLYKKELFTKRIEFLLIFAFNILWPLFVVLGPNWINSNGNDKSGISVAVPIAVVGLWAIWISFKSISYEWEHNTSYLLLSLPISGMKVLAVKIAGILTMLLAFIIEVVTTGLLVVSLVDGHGISFQGLTFKVLMMIVGDCILGLFYILSVAAIMVIICQFVFILSRLVNKFSKIFAAIAACVSIWVFFRGTALLTFLINFLHLPDIKLLFVEEPLYCNPSPLIATLLLAFGFFYATAKLFDHVIEV